MQQRIAGIEQILAKEGDSLMTGLEVFKKEIGVVRERGRRADGLDGRPVSGAPWIRIRARPGADEPDE